MYHGFFGTHAIKLVFLSQNGSVVRRYRSSETGENMAGTFTSRKKKVTQNDLRRIMNEQKRKFSETIKKIDSPLAKYPFKHIGFRLYITHCIVYVWLGLYVLLCRQIFIYKLLFCELTESWNKIAAPLKLPHLRRKDVQDV